MNKPYALLLTLTSFCFFSFFSSTQAQTLPVGLSREELKQVTASDYILPFYNPAGITTPPDKPVRAAAEWEEIQALLVAWPDNNYATVSANIVKAAQQQTKVYILCTSANLSSVKSSLSANGVSLTNVEFIECPINSVWIRDFGANPVYINDVEDQLLVDWTYNRPRPDDDKSPQHVAQKLAIPLYETTTGANKLTNTGGNFMSDGMGTAFASKLVQNENSSLSTTQINKIMKDFMGIDRYINMNTLPYDGIHHIDMHMKLLDEETLLIGEYPNGVSDGPQIEANLQFILQGYKSVFGTPYKIIRIPQPPDQQNGNKYPNNGGSYLTYANATFVNKTVIVPQYYAKYDTTALRIWRNALPGYTITGINSNVTISASGSLHCMTHCVGAKDPLLIVHQQLPNTANTTSSYKVDAIIKHRSGIKTATLYYRTDKSKPYESANMTLIDPAKNTWSGDIPPQDAGKHVYYYIKGEATSGKQITRPIVAPEGYFKFDVNGTNSIGENTNLISLHKAYPNPSKGITCIPLSVSRSITGSIKLYDMVGKQVAIIHEGELTVGDSNYFINTTSINSGAYLVVAETADGSRYTQKLMIK